MTIAPWRFLLASAVVASLLASCKQGTRDRPAGPTKEELAAMREECARIMPKTFATVWVGMTEEDLKLERPEAKFQAQRTDPFERRWYNETSPTGVTVWYGVDRETERLAVVQFAHRFVSWSTFRSHAVALQDRFGTEYELYTCPPAAQTKASMSRLLWPRQPVAVMEAIFELGDSISVTMMVSRVEDLRKGVEKQQCVRLDRDKAMEFWLEQKVKEEEEALRKQAEEDHAHGVTPPQAPEPADQQPENTGEK
jgi:hypothetical protein